MIERFDRCFEYKLCVLAVALALGALGYWMLRPEPLAVVSAPAKVLQTISTHAVAVPEVQVYSEVAKKKLSLPKVVQADKAQVVLVATDLPKDKHERTVSSVLNLDTGITTNYVETKPLAWLAKENTGSAGIYTGFKDGESAIRLQVTQDVFTVKALTFGAIATVDLTNAGHTDTFIGIGGKYEW
jgi:hypothetical protein